MPCYYPCMGYRSKVPNKNGKFPLVFDSSGDRTQPVQFPCGQCVGCRLERSRQWAVRCVQEASLHVDNCFITLTYDDNNLPSDNALHIRDFQLFMKRLRKDVGKKVRFFHCGEYGKETRRPHYHALLFGYDFKDKLLWKEKNGVPWFLSEYLTRLWKNGHTTVGAVTFESAAYVARYCLKKSDKVSYEEHVAGRTPEYVTMSRRPGIAAEWYKRFWSDIYPHDIMEANGVKQRPPRFFDGRFELDNPDKYEDLKLKRELKARDPCMAQHTLPARLRVREEVKLRKIALLKRDIDF